MKVGGEILDEATLQHVIPQAGTGRDPPSAHVEPRGRHIPKTSDMIDNNEDG